MKHPAQRGSVGRFGEVRRHTTAVQDYPPNRYLAGTQHHDRHCGVIQSAEARASHDNCIEVARLGKVEDGLTPVQRNHHPSCALDHDNVTILAQASDAGFNVIWVQRDTCTLGGDRRRERLGQLKKWARQLALLSRGARQHIRVGGLVIAKTGFRRLESDRVQSTGP